MQMNTRFFTKILLPSLFAIILFLVAIYLFVIPNYRESLMNGKRETIRELTNSALSVIEKLDAMVNENFSLENARFEAALIIGDMRYGEDMKDYFWITDTTPIMIMHPYRPSMIGMDLSDYRDTHGKNFFVDIVHLVKESGDGYVDYKWQWKDDSLTVVSKLSYVKVYEPWGWIVGTGIYIDDVNREISSLTQKVVWISIFITLLVGAIISYLARRNYIAEQERGIAQAKLHESMERYKKLVEASTDGVLMIMDKRIVYCNPYLLDLLEYNQADIESGNDQLLERLKELVPAESDIADEFHPPSEQRISSRCGKVINVVVNRSNFEMAGKEGLIFTIKDISQHKDVERELDLSIEKLSIIADILKLGLFHVSVGKNAGFTEINSHALKMFKRSSLAELNDTNLPDLLQVSDDKKEFNQAYYEGLPIKQRLVRVFQQNGNSLLYYLSLFPVKDTYGRLVAYDGILMDAYEHLQRKSNFRNEFSTPHLSANILLHPVKDYLLPAPVCELNTPVNLASKIMKAANSDILLVINNSLITGLITHSDISRRLVAVSGDSSLPVSDIMSAPVISVSIEDMVMDAFNLMIQNKISYVVVKSSGEIKPSYISLLRLSEIRRDTPEYLLNSIQKAESIYEISEAASNLPRLITNLVDTGTGIASVGKLISKLADTIAEKLINDSIAALGAPPCPFVFLSLGSEGRREQTLATDQDNAILFNPPHPDQIEICRKYFLELGSKICTSLSQTGYPLCHGDIMAMNREWCRSMSEWELLVSAWVSSPNPQEVLNISIFFDFRPVYGEFALASELQNFCHNLLKDKGNFFFNLAKSIVSLRLPSLDAGLKNREEYDLKTPVFLITSIARLWALKFGVSERNTSERLNALQEAGILSPKLKDAFEQGFYYIMHLRIKNQLQQISAGIKVNNEISVNKLADFDVLMIKKLSTTISDHQNRLLMEFRL
jgi:PAS domain S-box-containing protein